MKHEELTSLILKAAFEVANELGPGFMEKVYQESMIIALNDLGVNVQDEVPIEVFFRGKSVGHYIVDLLVANVVIVELKSVKALLSEHQAQVINYLKASQIEVGLLINFGTSKIEYRRLYKPE